MRINVISIRVYAPTVQSKPSQFKGPSEEYVAQRMVAPYLSFVFSGALEPNWGLETELELTEPTIKTNRPNRNLLQIARIGTEPVWMQN